MVSKGKKKKKGQNLVFYNDTREITLTVGLAPFRNKWS